MENEAEKVNLWTYIFHDPDLFGVRVFFILSCIIGLANLANISFHTSIQLIFVQNILFPFLIVLSLLSSMKVSSRSQQLKLGVIGGAISGAIPAAIGIASNSVIYYFFSGREEVLNTLGIPPTPLTLDSLLGGLYAEFIQLCFLTAMSILIGLVAVGIYSIHRRARK
jgi:hypothetical protein